jgi:TRAP-type mannitol/chloroaromatic compound transport system substrate-binding protein
MKRRTFLKAGTMAGLAGAGLARPAIAQSMPQVTWRLTSSFPKSLDTIFGTAQVFARAVTEATDGRFQIQVFAPGEIVPGLQALDAVTSGAVESAQTPLYFYAGKDPALAIGTGLTFGLNARQQHAWWHFNGGGDLINQAMERQRAIAIPMGNSGCQMGGWFKKEINDVADLKGLKFRIGGLGGHILAKLGVVPQQIAAGDVYPALEKGSLDAVEFVGPHDDEKLGFNRIARYYYYPGFWEGGAMLHLVVGLEHWSRLPKLYQTYVRHAAEFAHNWMLAKYDTVNPAALRRLVASGTVLKPFPIGILDAAWTAANEVHTELAAQSPGFRIAYESLVAFRSEQYLWWQIGEHAFDGYMIRQRNRA